MSDTTPDPAGDEDASSAPRVRRAGLDRLRAARSGGEAESSTATPTSTAGVAEPQASAAGGGRRRGNATAGTDAVGGSATTLLETPTTESPPESTTAEESTAPDGLSEAPSRRARQRRRKASSDVAGGTAERERLGRSGRATTTAGATDANARPAGQRQTILAVALAVLVIALLIPVIAMRHRIIGPSKDDKAITSLVDKRTEALAEARRFAVTFFSPDYKTIDQYSDQVSSQSSGQFNADFVSKRGELKSLLTKVQSQASGRVLAAGVSKISGNDAEVLVVADQDVKNTTSQGKTVTNRYRVRVSLTKGPKGWLVTNVEPVV